jgi:hypothetical protein
MLGVRPYKLLPEQRKRHASARAGICDRSVVKRSVAGTNQENLEIPSDAQQKISRQRAGVLMDGKRAECFRASDYRRSGMVLLLYATFTVRQQSFTRIKRIKI